jgi:hypothetical protein
MTQHNRTDLWIPLGLVALLLATRVGHFGTAWVPPNATLAVFFLAGLAVTSGWFFALLAGLCIATDGLALSLGTSAACMSPAYVFMVPAHLMLFGAGRWAGRQGAGVPAAALALVVGTAAFFLVSNASFYLLSGKFADMGVLEYASRVARYFPFYLGMTALYVGIVFAARSVVRLAGGRDHAPPAH